MRLGARNANLLLARNNLDSLARNAGIVGGTQGALMRIQLQPTRPGGEFDASLGAAIDEIYKGSTQKI